MPVSLNWFLSWPYTSTICLIIYMITKMFTFTCIIFYLPRQMHESWKWPISKTWQNLMLLHKQKRTSCSFFKNFILSVEVTTVFNEHFKKLVIEMYTNVGNWFVATHSASATISCKTKPIDYLKIDNYSFH